jgi:hypothetical protein
MLNQLIVATAMPFACPERRREAALGLATLLVVSAAIPGCRAEPFAAALSPPASI